VSKKIKVSSDGSAFVDDSSLGVTSHYKWNNELSSHDNINAEIQHVISALQQKAQHWKKTPF